MLLNFNTLLLAFAFNQELMSAKKKSGVKKAASKPNSDKARSVKEIDPKKTSQFKFLGELIRKGEITTLDKLLEIVSKTALGDAIGIFNVSLNKKLKDPHKFTFHDAQALSDVLGIGCEQASSLIWNAIKTRPQK